MCFSKKNIHFKGVVNAGVIYCQQLSIVGTIAFCASCQKTIGYVDKYDFVHFHNVRLRRFDAAGAEIIGARRELFPVVTNHNVVTAQKRAFESPLDGEPPRKKTRLEEDVLLMCVELTDGESAVVYEVDENNFRTSTPNRLISPSNNPQDEFFNYLRLQEDKIEAIEENSFLKPIVVLERLERSDPIIISDHCSMYDSYNEVNTFDAGDVVTVFDSSIEYYANGSDYSDWSEDVFPLDDLETPDSHRPCEMMGMISILSSDSFELADIREHENFRAASNVPIYGKFAYVP